MVEIESFTYCAGSYWGLMLPFALWFGLVGVQYYSSDISLVWVGALYYPQLFINHVLKTLVAQPFPHGCRDGFEFPSLETQLTFSVITLVLIVNSLKGTNIGIARTSLLIGAALFVPLVLYVTGDSTLGAILAGMVLGLIVTLLALVIFLMYIEPIYEVSKQWSIITKLGYTDNLCKGLLLSLRQRDHAMN